MSQDSCFLAAKFGEQISAIKDKLYDLYLSNGYQDEANNLKQLLAEVTEDQCIRVVFIGQYTAGKSSIISALTGNNNILIDSDISTDHASDYTWSSGITLTDTPGLYTENPEHDQRTIEMIRKSDLLVYCITSDLFNQYTKADFLKWAFQVGYSGKMFLVINKMSKEAGKYGTLVENYSTTINATLSPHSLNEFPCSFIDAADYREGIANSSNDLVEISHFDDLISKLNRFVREKGQLGKLDTPVKILKDSISRMSESVVASDQDRAYFALLGRIEKRVDQRRSQVDVAIRRCVESGLRPITDKGFELSRSIGIEDISFTESDLNDLIQSCCETVNRELEEIISANSRELQADIDDVLKSESAEFFFKSVAGSISNRPKLFSDHKKARIDRQQFDTVNSVVEKISGQTIQLATSTTKTANFFIKSSEASGSTLHTVVKFVGSKIGYKFKPWEAVNIAKNIGNVAKVLGPVMSVIGFFFDVKETADESERDKKIQKAQMEYRAEFKKITEEIAAQYADNTKDVFLVYQEISDQISNGRTEYAQIVARNDKLSSELSIIQSELTEIQKGIFLST